MNQSPRPTSAIFQYYRETRRLNHTEMAQFLGCHRLRYLRLEKGIVKPQDDEWQTFLEGSHFNIPFQQLKVQDFAQAQFLLPPRHRKQAFLSQSIGVYFKNIYCEFFSQKGWSELLEESKIKSTYFINMANPYPYELWLRMIERLKLSGQLKDQESINHWAKAALESMDWWAQKWPGYQRIEGNKRLKICLVEWQNRSRNHHIEVKQAPATKNTIQLTIKPKQNVPKDLYFHHPVIKDFVGQWMTGQCLALAHREIYSKLERKEDSWIISLVTP
jgi:DNA-binding XRE family transcriptional regulator